MKYQDIYIRDPFIIVVNDEFYLFGSNGTKNFLAYHSLDMVNFDEPVVVFKPSEDFWGKKDFWAPEVHHYNGKYYLFASFKNDQVKRGTAILESNEVLGPYLPMLNSRITPENEEALDGTLYVDNGIPYLIYCHEWLEVKDGKMKIAPLTSDLETLAHEPYQLFSASESSHVQGFGKDKENFITDGPWIYKTKANKYLLLWSSTSKEGKYCEMQAVSDNLYGPYDQTNPLLYREDGGHGMIFKYRNKEYFICHTPNSFDGQERFRIFEVFDKGIRLELGKDVTGFDIRKV